MSGRRLRLLFKTWGEFDPESPPDKRPSQDEVRFNLEMQRLSPVGDGKGGYVLYDSYSHPRFHVLAPTVHDAAGKQGKATLDLTTTQAVIKVDPAFMTTATYPVTVDPTVNWTISSSATTFAYDRYAPVAQLTAVAALQGPESHSSYDYSERHNRLERVQGPTQPTNQQVTTAYTYDRADRILTATGLTYTVNKNGNLRERSGGSICDTFSYDQANRMTAAVVNSCGTSTTSSYSYNGDGLRITKTVGGGSAIRYVWDINRGLPTLLEDGTRKYVWGAQGLSHNVAISGGAVEVYHADQIGTIRELTSGSDGTLVQTYTHDEYGVPTQTDGSSTQPFRYTSELWDGGTGEPNLLYLRARAYEPGIGRFMSRDPFEGGPRSPITLHRYAYSGNNPINFNDASGHCGSPTLVCGALVAGDSSTIGTPEGAALATDFVDPSVLPIGLFGEFSGALDCNPEEWLVIEEGLEFDWNALAGADPTRQDCVALINYLDSLLGAGHNPARVKRWQQEYQANKETLSGESRKCRARYQAAGGIVIGPG
jgi:RHS repeat-associated protein